MIKSEMQFEDFNLVSVMQHAARWYGQTEVVTDSVEGGIKRISYENLYKRVGQLAHALKKLGVEPGDRVGTMAWNTWRHLECWYAIAGSGAICHTLNPRLSPDQIDYISNHAENKWLFVDSNILPVIENAMGRLRFLEGIVVMTDKENMPDASSFDVPVHCYEELIVSEPEAFEWPHIRKIPRVRFATPRERPVSLRAFSTPIDPTLSIL